jgi:D-serine deaminase-like pyridoxal phosphate-dependent protein
MLSSAMSAADRVLDVLMDVNSGQNRTGILPGPEAVRLYEQIDEAPGLRSGGLHFYDGHQRQSDREHRRNAVLQQLEPFFELRRTLHAKGLPIPRVVLGGTPTFPIYATLDVAESEFAPGTFVLHDQGYQSQFPDLTGFKPAALVLTRVVSRPTPDRVTLDLGTKAVASDPPAGQRCELLNVSEYEAVVHNEEHLVIRTPNAAAFVPGDDVFAVPTHVCPTCALHRFAYVVASGKVVDQWEIAARDRALRV